MHVPVFFCQTKKNLLRKGATALALFFFIVNIACPVPVYAQSFLGLPEPGTMMDTTSLFMPPQMSGILLYPDNPLKFDFIINSGDDQLKGSILKDESSKLIKYFLASLTIPEKNMWVNLSPYEDNRIIPVDFGKTEMGRDLLAQDYILKQLTSSLMYPEKELGESFWDRVYERAYDELGTTEIPLETINKVWIVADEAVVYEHDMSKISPNHLKARDNHLTSTINNRFGAFVYRSKLKVMLEADYLSLQKAQNDEAIPVQTDNNISLTTDVIKEIIIPEIEKEVNTGEHFTALRQIYHAMILATWFKKNLQESLLGKVYMDQSKTIGIENGDEEVNKKIYERYIKALQKGVYNYIREDYDPTTQQVIPRKYFSGGCQIYASKAYEEISGDQAFEDFANAVSNDRNPYSRVVTEISEQAQDDAQKRPRIYEDLRIDKKKLNEMQKRQASATIVHRFSDINSAAFREKQRHVMDNVLMPIINVLERNNMPSISRKNLVFLAHKFALMDAHSTHFASSLRIGSMLTRVAQNADKNIDEAKEAYYMLVGILHDVGKQGPFLKDISFEEQNISELSTRSGDDEYNAAISYVIGKVFSINSAAMEQYEDQGNTLTTEQKMGLITIEDYLKILNTLKDSIYHIPMVQQNEGEIDGITIMNVLAQVVNPITKKNFDPRVDTMRDFWNAHTFWSYDILTELGLPEEYIIPIMYHHVYRGILATEFNEQFAPRMGREISPEIKKTMARLMLLDVYEALLDRSQQFDDEKNFGILEGITKSKIFNNMDLLPTSETDPSITEIRKVLKETIAAIRKHGRQAFDEPVYTDTSLIRAEQQTAPQTTETQDNTGTKTQEDFANATNMQATQNKENVGGIDLNSANLKMQIKRDENGVAYPVYEQPIDQMQIFGFSPIIINVEPIQNLPMYLGRAPAAEHPKHEDSISRAEAGIIINNRV